MQRNKDKKKQSELSFLDEKGEKKVLLEVMKFFEINDSFSVFNFLKRSGLIISTGLILLLLLPFLGINSIGKMFQKGFTKKQRR